MRSKAILFFLFNFFFSAFVFWNCSSRQETEASESDLQFDVNPKLLEAEFVDSLMGVKVKIPVGCNNLSAYNSETLKLKLQAYLNQDSSIRAVYIDTLSQLSVFVSSKKKWNAGDLKRIYQSPDSALNSLLQWEQVVKSDFTIRGFPVYQYLLQNKDIVNFRLIGKPSVQQTFQIDYVIAKTTYLKQVKKVESSIGSIEIL